MCRRLAQKEGMLVGGSAGLNLHAAVEISKTAKPGSVIVAILADNGVKYLTKIYNNDWIKAKVCMCFLHSSTPQFSIQCLQVRGHDPASCVQKYSIALHSSV